MSLSQKHAGKALVPWFNMAEWKTVYELIFSNDIVLRRKALEILYVWKIRTPILPSGVEGTLIILEALSVDATKLTDGEVSALYSTAVLRFLNICAASNDRQGTFVKLAKENDIPAWLVSIRHDIAHDSRIPSVAMLTLCLDFCLKWVEEKHWKQQFENVKDFIISEQKNEKRTYNLFYTYIVVNMNLYKGKYYEDLDGEVKTILSNILPKKLRKFTPSLYVLRDYLLDMLENEKENDDFISCCKEITNDLIKQDVLLCVESASSNKGTKYIPKEFRNIWINLLKLYINKNVIFCVINYLFKTTNSVCDSKMQETAAAWIVEIFSGLLRLKFATAECINSDEDFNQRHPDLADALDFGHQEDLPIDDANLFLDKILREPNDFTLLYLKRVFEFTSSSEAVADMAMDMVKSLSSPENAQHDGEIGTIESIDFKHLEADCSEDDISSSKEIPNFTPTRWKRIDAKQFEGCPLGILPHQDRSQNPLLVL